MFHAPVAGTQINHIMDDKKLLRANVLFNARKETQEKLAVVKQLQKEMNREAPNGRTAIKLMPHDGDHLLMTPAREDQLPTIEQNALHTFLVLLSNSLQEFIDATNKEYEAL